LPEDSTEEAKFMGKQRNDPFSSRYSARWKDHPNFGWAQTGNQAQGGATQPRKSSPLEELLSKFASMRSNKLREHPVYGGKSRRNN
jgi:hypothetical protein